jgi:hypothetical protein
MDSSKRCTTLATSVDANCCFELGVSGEDSDAIDVCDQAKRTTKERAQS